LYKGGSSAGRPGYELYTSSTASTMRFKANDGTDMVDSENVPITFDKWMYFVGVVNRISDTIHIFKALLTKSASPRESAPPLGSQQSSTTRITRVHLLM
jgi:hypothetical protein